MADYTFHLSGYVVTIDEKDIDGLIALLLDKKSDIMEARRLALIKEVNDEQQV